MTSFIVENVSVPPEVEQAIDKRSSMAAVGNLNDYVKFQMAQGMDCLLYTSDAADERSSVDLGGRRIIKKKKKRRSHMTVRYMINM